MFERFTDRARRVLVLAQEEARLMGHGFIGTEHILLGLISEHDGVAALALRQSGVTLEATRNAVQDILGFHSTAGQGSPPFTPRAKKCLELALREALTMGHSYIGTEHLLLGVLREAEGVACAALERLAVDLVALWDEVIEMLPGVDSDAAASPSHRSAEERLHVLEGTMRALSQLGDIVAAVGACADRAAAVAVLTAAPFNFSSEQVHQVLDLRVDMVIGDHLSAIRNQTAALRQGLEGPERD